MTSQRAVIYGAGGVVLAACLAAANMPQEADTVAPRARTMHAAAPDALASDISSQASRLHTLMAQAPIPAPNSRNPFSFRAPRVARTVPLANVGSAASTDAPAPIVSAPLPPLTLMGVAEETTPAGPRRTAVIGGEGDAIYMVAEGDAVGDRYRVTKIGADAV